MGRPRAAPTTPRSMTTCCGARRRGWRPTSKARAQGGVRDVRARGRRVHARPGLPWGGPVEQAPCGCAAIVQRALCARAAADAAARALRYNSGGGVMTECSGRTRLAARAMAAATASETAAACGPGCPVGCPVVAACSAAVARAAAPHARRCGRAVSCEPQRGRTSLDLAAWGGHGELRTTEGKDGT